MRMSSPQTERMGQSVSTSRTHEAPFWVPAVNCPVIVRASRLCGLEVLDDWKAEKLGSGSVSVMPGE